MDEDPVQLLQAQIAAKGQEIGLLKQQLARQAEYAEDLREDKQHLKVEVGHLREELQECKALVKSLQVFTFYEHCYDCCIQL